MASGDTIGDQDEVAAIIGAPQSVHIKAIVAAFHQKDAEAGVAAIAAASSGHVDMKLCVRLVLEQVRAVMLLRNAPGQAETVLARFGEEAKAELTAMAGDSSSAINSHLLVRLLEAASKTGKTALPTLPLEIVFLEMAEAKTT